MQLTTAEQKSGRAPTVLGSGRLGDTTGLFLEEQWGITRP